MGPQTTTPDLRVRDQRRTSGFNHAIDKVVVLANSPLHLSVGAATIVTVAGLGYALAEGEGVITSLWWAVITASTVGYGDAYPETTAGRAVATFLIISMVTMILPMITASFTSKLIVDRDAFTHESKKTATTPSLR